MNLTPFYRAVAAATGRRFKSCRPDRPLSLMFYCYVLRSQKTGRRYVGSCEDRYATLFRHNAGDTKATKHGVPWSLIHSEAFSTRGEATARERYYKTGRGRAEEHTSEHKSRYDVVCH